MAEIPELKAVRERQGRQIKWSNVLYSYERYWPSLFLLFKYLYEDMSL